ncbi:MAG: hypothetical protein IT200_08365 [Thermoleophilia bacterium]|nr:hypothetical protein [Thermoleophilia bacterium]
MTGAMRIAGFAVGVVAVAGVAAAVGLAVGPLDRGHDDSGGHGGDGHSTTAMDDHAAPPGLAVAQDGLTLAPRVRTAAAGTTAEYAFRILGEDGRPVRDFDVEHDREMHLIVVRRDLTGFQHLHPRMDPDGTWRTPLRPEAAGTHRVFADFSHEGDATTLGVDLGVPGTAGHDPLPAPAATSTAGAYTVRMQGSAVQRGTESDLGFEVSRDGARIGDLQPYLGARGHLVALREGDLAFLHVHPLDDATAGPSVRFRVEWPSPGRYRLFLQVRHDGRIVTTPFTVEVRS